MFESVTNAAVSSLKKFIQLSYKKHGGQRAAGRAMEIDYQRMAYYTKENKKRESFLEFLAKLRKDLRLSKSAFYGAIEDEVTKGDRDDETNTIVHATNNRKRKR